MAALNLFEIGGFLFFFAAVQHVLRMLAMHQAIRMSNRQKDLPRELRPAELAYLVRQGDMTHTLTVLSVDLIQRSLKAGNAEKPPPGLASYESKVWEKVKQFVTGWAQDKANQLNPFASANPAVVLRRLNVIKVFFTRTAAAFIRDLIKDPRRIRNYFTVGGVARLVVDLTGGGYGAMVEEEMRGELVSRGLLVPLQNRIIFGWIFLFAAFLGSIALAGTGIILFQSGHIDVPNPVFVSCVVLGTLNGFALRALLLVPKFVPFYEEIRSVLEEAGRDSWQVRLTRTLFRAAAVIAYFLVAAAVALMLAADTLVLLLTGASNIPSALFATAGFAAVAMVFLQMLMDSHALLLREHPTAAAQSAVEEARRALRQARAVDSFKTVLSDPSYDPAFSRLVAVYGIETVWLLS